MTIPTWAVATTVFEPPQLLAAFAAHYAALGASEIRFYFDRPDPVGEALVCEIPQCSVVQADKDHFRTSFNVPKPENIYRRQRFNANHAYRATEADWLLHVDADEFLAPVDLVSELGRPARGCR